MGLGQVIAELLIDLGKAAVTAVRSRKSAPPVRESAKGTRSDSAEAYDELVKAVEKRKQGGPS